MFSQILDAIIKSEAFLDSKSPLHTKVWGLDCVHVILEKSSTRDVIRVKAYLLFKNLKLQFYPLEMYLFSALVLERNATPDPKRWLNCGHVRCGCDCAA
jgi:hypothetical protein